MIDFAALLETALRCGIGVQEFWELTPKELLAAVEAANWRHAQDQRRDVRMAWHVAALSRAKRLPSLQKLLKPGKARALHGEELERRRAERDELLERMQPLLRKGETAGAKPAGTLAVPEEKHGG